MDQRSMDVIERRAALEAFTRSVCDPQLPAPRWDSTCDLRLPRGRMPKQRFVLELPLASSNPEGYEEAARQQLAAAVRSICVSESVGVLADFLST